MVVASMMEVTVGMMAEAKASRMLCVEINHGIEAEFIAIKVKVGVFY